MEKLDKDLIEKVKFSLDEVSILGNRVLFWVNWNLVIIRNDQFYRKILEDLKKRRIKAFNSYLETINKIRTPSHSEEFFESQEEILVHSLERG